MKQAPVAVKGRSPGSREPTDRSLVNLPQFKHSCRVSSRWSKHGLTLLVWGVALGLAYGQSPLYTSNQNQYFLHGLAQAGVGQLQADWLAGTRDPTPLFSLLVRFMALSPGTGAQSNPAGTSPSLGSLVVLNYSLYLLVFAVYLAALFGIARRLYGIGRNSTAALLFLGMVFVSHSAALRFALGLVPGGEWGYLFDGGMGGQRLLGPVFQPSVFGVLLLFSIWLYLEDRELPAMLATTLAASFHPTYLLSAATLSAIYWVSLIRRSPDLRRPLAAAAATLMAVAPIVIYVVVNFSPASSTAQQIIVDFRIPDHALPTEWFDLTSVAKLALIAAAILMIPRTRLLPVMLGLLAVAGTLTILQLILGSDSLALLFPWRLSATLVPLSAAALAGRLANALSEAPGRIPRAGLLPAAGWLAAGLAVASGIAWSAVQFQQRQSAPEHPVFEYVRTTLSRGQQYLVPPKMQDFRLATGAPILSDFKAIPYRGSEVLEWYQRVRLLQYFYRGRPSDVDCGMLEVFANEYRVTQVVLEPDQHGLDCDRFELQYDDGAYSVYALVGKPQ